jgi:hypothetical protein
VRMPHGNRYHATYSVVAACEDYRKLVCASIAGYFDTIHIHSTRSCSGWMN